MPCRLIGNEVDRPTTPNSEQISTLVPAFQDTLQLAMTPTNVAQVQELIRHICKANGAVDPIALQHLNKIGKGACQAIANAQIQRLTNVQLLAALEQKKQQANRLNEHYGFAQVMGCEVIKERQAKFYQKWMEMHWKDLTKIQLDIFPTPVKRSPVKAVTGRGNQRAFNAAVKPYLKLSLDIFDDQVSISPPKPLVQTMMRSPIKTRRIATIATATVDPELVVEQEESPPQFTRTGRLITKRRLFGA